MQISIVIPCYNESKNIPLILNRFSEVIQSDEIEIILVNNGSTDDSDSVMNELIPQYSFARYVNVPVNQGYGYGILSGLETAQGEYMGWTHADMQTDPHDPINAFNLITSHPTPQNLYVKGNRKGRSLFDVFFTLGMSLFETLYLRKWLWDINAQPNIIHRSLYEKWENPPYDFSFDLFAIYTAKYLGYEVKRFDVFFPERIHGESSWNTGLLAKWKFIKRTIDFSFQLKRRLR